MDIKTSAPIFPVKNSKQAEQFNNTVETRWQQVKSQNFTLEDARHNYAFFKTAIDISVRSFQSIQARAQLLFAIVIVLLISFIAIIWLGLHDHMPLSDRQFHISLGLFAAYGLIATVLCVSILFFNLQLLEPPQNIWPLTAAPEDISTPNQPQYDSRKFLFTETCYLQDVLQRNDTKIKIMKLLLQFAYVFLLFLPVLAVLAFIINFLPDAWAVAREHLIFHGAAMIVIGLFLLFKLGVLLAALYVYWKFRHQKPVEQKTK